MITIGKILVPVDFSEDSRKAVRYGVEISRDRNAELFFLHVINQRIVDALREMSVRGYQNDFVDAIKRLVQDRERDLAEFVPADWRQGLKTEFVMRKGKPSEEIINLAKELTIDLIVLGSRGHSALASVLTGSVARNVVNHAPCPVLVVRPLAHDFIA